LGLFMDKVKEKNPAAELNRSIFYWIWHSIYHMLLMGQMPRYVSPKTFTATFGLFTENLARFTNRLNAPAP
jgi:hypothetical protein